MNASSPGLPFLPRDARNRGFRWTDRRGPFRVLRPEQAAAYDRNGFVVLEDVFSPRVVAAMTAEIDAGLTDAESFHDCTFARQLVLRSNALRAFCRCSTFRDLGFDLIGPDVRLYWDQAVFKRPGSAPFAWHQDNGYEYVEPQQYLTCWVALTDATPDNGCPSVFPGLHRNGTLEHRPSTFGMTCVDENHVGPLEGAVALPASAGSIVAFSSLTPHITGPNRSSEVRKAYILQFAPDGAETLRNGERRPCRSPSQFPILVGGRAAEHE